MNLLRIKTLVENTACGRGIIAEHGFALWIEYRDKNILFDTGQGAVIRNNAKIMEVDLDKADAVVLSHGHYDHTGGLGKILNGNSKKQVFAHPDSLLGKYARHADGSVHEAGISSICRDKLETHSVLDFVEDTVEIYNHVHLTGPVPRFTDFEDTGGQFFSDKECLTTDCLIDDQAAFIETPYGLVVILGCAHSGIINTLNYIRELTDNTPVYAVIGGMHLINSTEDRMNTTILELKKIGLKKLYPAHCTGFNAMARIWQEFPGICKPCNAGVIIEI